MIGIDYSRAQDSFRIWGVHGDLMRLLLVVIRTIDFVMIHEWSAEWPLRSLLDSSA